MSLPLVVFSVDNSGNAVANLYNVPLGSLPLTPSSTWTLPSDMGSHGNGAAVAVYDSSGNIYVWASFSSYANGRIYKFSPTGSRTVVFAPSDTPSNDVGGCMAIDSVGNFYLIDSNGNIQKYTSSGGGPTLFAAHGPGNGYQAIAFNSAGNLIAAGSATANASYLHSYTPSGAKTVLNSGFDPNALNQSGLVFDASGNIYLLTYDLGTYGGYLWKFSASGAVLNSSLASFYGSTPTWPSLSMGLEPTSGDIYVVGYSQAYTNNYKGFQVTQAGSKTTLLATGSNTVCVAQFPLGSTSPIPPGWLVTNEPFDTSPPTSPNYIIRSNYIDFNDGAQNTFQLMMRQRGRATIPFRVKRGDPYVPTMGMQTFLFDDTPAGWTLVFAGSVDDCVLTYVGLGGDRLYTVTSVTFDQCLDVVQVPPQTFPAGSNTGYIVTSLFNALMGGAPITLGTIQTSVTLGTPYTISDWTPLSQVINDLANISQFIWGVNYAALTLYFQLPFTTAAPFALATNQVRNPGGKPSWSWRQKRQDYRNRQINKIAASAFSPSSELFTSGGTSFTLKRPPATVTDAWVTQNTQNHATASLSGNPSNGDTVTVSYPSAGSIYNWAPNSPYATGQIIVDPAGHIQKVTTQGTSGATIPTFSDTTTGGGTTTDGPGTPDPPPFNGAVIWTDQGIAGGGLYDAVVYTFVTTLDNTQWGQVLIGANSAATVQNLADAINANQTVAGLTFSWPTWENPLINAGTVSSSSFTIQNKAAGAGYIAALAKTGTAFSWSAAVTSGGSTSSSTTYVLQVAQNGSSNTANLYYTPGSTTVAIASVPQSAVALPLSGGWNLQVQYTRQGGDTIVCERSDLVAARAIIEGGTGKYQAKTSDTNQVNANLGLLECQEDLAAYDTLPIELTFATFIPGLTTGQYLNISVSDIPVGVAALINGEYVIQEIRAKLIRTNPWMNQRTVPGGGHYEYTVTVINVGVIGSYLDFWKGNLGSGGGASSSVVGLASGSPAGSGTVAGSVTPTSQSANLAGAGRALGTVYQNTSAKPIFVSVTATGSVIVALAAVSDSSATPTAPVSTLSTTSTVASMFFLVLAGNYYEVTTSAGSTLTGWFEWS